jgi:nucleotide-binding universal stress UspA family protein
MTCHDDYERTAEGTTISPHYVVGVDGSPAGAAALRWAVHQASTTGGTVEAVYAFHGQSLLPAARAAYLPPAPPASLAQQLDAEETLAAHVHAALTDDPTAASSVRRAAVGGEPRHVLVDRSAEADVLVLGASHRTAFATRVLGSTASTCAAVAHCPVMVVPEAWAPRPAAEVASASVG